MYFNLFLERGEGRGGKRERSIGVQEKHLLAVSRMPPTGNWPKSQMCALTRNQTGDLLVCGMMPNPLSHTSQSCIPFSYSSFMFPYRCHLGLLFMTPLSPPNMGSNLLREPVLLANGLDGTVLLLPVYRRQ